MLGNQSVVRVVIKLGRGVTGELGTGQVVVFVPGVVPVAELIDSTGGVRAHGQHRAGRWPMDCAGNKPRYGDQGFLLRLKVKVQNQMSYPFNS